MPPISNFSVPAKFPAITKNHTIAHTSIPWNLWNVSNRYLRQTLRIRAPETILTVLHGTSRAVLATSRERNIRVPKRNKEKKSASALTNPCLSLAYI